MATRHGFLWLSCQSNPSNVSVKTQPAYFRYIKELMTEAGLTIREDPMGSIYGGLEGTNPAAGDGTAMGHYILLNKVFPHRPACAWNEKPSACAN